jgi:hypothetical protein
MQQAERSPIVQSAEPIETMVINLADMKAEKEYPTTDLDTSAMMIKTSISSIGLRKKSTMSFEPELRQQMSIEMGKADSIAEDEELVVVTESIEIEKLDSLSHKSTDTVKRAADNELKVETTNFPSPPLSPLSSTSAKSADILGPLPVKKTRIELDDPKSRSSISVMPDRNRESLFHKEAKRAQSMDVRQFQPNSDDEPVRESIALVRGNANIVLKAHSGPIDQRALTSLPADILLERVFKILKLMDLEITATADPFKLVVERIPTLGHKTSQSTTKSGKSVSFFQKLRYISTFGFQYNRGYDGSMVPPPTPTTQSYMKFHVMIHRIKHLKGLVIVDLKRIKGDIWEFKRIYHDIIVKLDLNGELVPS